MSTYSRLLFSLLLVFPALLDAQTSASKSVEDSLSRTNPRSSVTAFLQACQHGNYTLAADYLDLSEIPARERSAEGPERAKRLEAILNSDSHFNVLRLSQAAEGDLADDPNPSLEAIGSVLRDGKPFQLELQREQVQPGDFAWLFAPATVAAIPELTVQDHALEIESRLPKALVTTEFLETPAWKWLALLLVVAVMVALFRLGEAVALLFVKRFNLDMSHSGRRDWIAALVRPWLVFMAALVFGMAEQFVDPSALSRLYIGRAVMVAVVWALAWSLINIVDLFLMRVDSMLDPVQRAASHSLIYMGKRAAKVAIFSLAAIIVLDNWGYNMTTMIAGLGVGGIAVALAAQSTIANVFGGVSVIADRPVRVGDFGNFGGVKGTVEDIGLRSTRIRTVSRTVMSIPNSSFAGMNLENYTLRDKILFNPTLYIKRGTAREKIESLMSAIEAMLKRHDDIEVGPAPVRLTTLAADLISLEVFAYARTTDGNAFLKIQDVLLLELDGVVASSEVELVKPA